MKTAISIPDDLFRAGEEAARRLGLSRSELYRRALGAYLERNRRQLVTEALNDVYSGESTGDALDPGLQSLQDASLPDEGW